MIKDRWNSKLIYQFRRFIKYYKPISSNEAYILLNFIISNKLYNWVFLNILYDLYIDTSFVLLNKFLDSNYLKEWISRYKDSANGDKNLLLIEFREYVDKKYKVG